MSNRNLCLWKVCQLFYHSFRSCCGYWEPVTVMSSGLLVSKEVSKLVSKIVCDFSDLMKQAQKYLKSCLSSFDGFSPLKGDF